MAADHLRIDRRTVLGTAGAGLVLAVAGCLGEDDDPDDGNDGNGDPDDGTGDPNDGAGQLSESAEFPADEECAVCNMVAADHPDWNAQLVHENEVRTFFCSSGCLVAYAVDPAHFDGPDNEVANAWTTGYETGELVDVAGASFVRVTDADHVDDIMMLNPIPFADRADAEAFVGEFAAYDQDDIVAFEAFDHDDAELYRGQFFEEE